MSSYSFPIQHRGPKYVHVNTVSTTTAKTAPGILHSVVVNSPGTGSTVTIYDSLTASGAVIAVLTGLACATLTYDVPFSVGLTVACVGGTPPSLTVKYL